jgi:hypothetical protein
MNPALVKKPRLTQIMPTTTKILPDIFCFKFICYFYLFYQILLEGSATTTIPRKILVLMLRANLIKSKTESFNESICFD